MQPKNLEFGHEARAKILAGAKKLAAAVKTTLGPKGRNVVIEVPSPQKGGPSKYHVTKDGVTTAESILLRDKLENIGAQLLREAAQETRDQAGDGTTTATTIAEALLVEGMRLVSSGYDPMGLKRGIDKAAEFIASELKEMSKPVKHSSEINQVAFISSNSDAVVADMITQAMDKVGNHGIVTLEEAKNNREPKLKFATGFEFDRGWAHQYFITDAERQRVVLEHDQGVFIWLIPAQVATENHFQDMLPVLEACGKSGRPILIIADGCENVVLATLLTNKIRGALNVAAVKSPGFGSTRMEMMGDIAVLTGAHLRDTAGGDDPIVGTTFDELGLAKKVIITKETTTIVCMDGREEPIEKRVNEIRALLSQDQSAWDKDKLEQRIAKLTGGAAVIEIGAESEVQLKELKDRFEDSLMAVKSAIRSGILPGASTGLLRAADKLSKKEIITHDDKDERAGVKVCITAASAPLKAIVANAGASGDVVVSRVLAEKSIELGYDVRTDQVVDMFKAGIIDPTAVSLSALKSAVSVAGTMLTMECAITVDDIEDDND